MSRPNRQNRLQELFKLGSDLLRVGGARAAGRPVLDAPASLGEGLQGIVEGSWVALTGAGVRREDMVGGALPSGLLRELQRAARS